MIPIGFLEFGIKDLIETLIIAAMLFFLYRWIRGSFAVKAFVGIILIFLINALVSALGLTTLNYILKSILDVGILAVFIIFQPEIRKLLYNLGQNTSLDKIFSTAESDSVIDEVINAVREMSRTKTGALIVFAKSASITEVLESGQKLDAKVNGNLLISLFKKESPLHDGAVVIKGDRIMAASCYLPISNNNSISTVFGTRHRAALGISEVAGVFVVIVSEETGRISIAENGLLTSGLTIQKLRHDMQKSLGSLISGDETPDFSKSEVELG